MSWELVAQISVLALVATVLFVGIIGAILAAFHHIDKWMDS